MTDEFVSVFGNRAADLYSQRSINTVYFDNIPNEDLSDQELETSLNLNIVARKAIRMLISK
ncbi:MAG: hypothetical protein HC831_24355 [Chloroflexia bacterium]|nr:hypothetical protein [Chloroflexia bacterium]